MEKKKKKKKKSLIDFEKYEGFKCKSKGPMDCQGSGLGFLSPPFRGRGGGSSGRGERMAPAPPPLGELEGVQLSILRRIEELERRLLPEQLASISISPPPSRDRDVDGGGIAGESTEARLSGILRALGVGEFEFRRVPADYYCRTLEYRMECLGAHSIEHLCKSIVMVFSSEWLSIYIFQCSELVFFPNINDEIICMARFRCPEVKSMLWKF